MKKIMIILSLLLYSTIGFAQDEALTVDAEGNVGINNSTPETALDVVGNVKVTGDITCALHI